MGLLNDLVKDIVSAGTQTLRDEVRQETRSTVRQGISKVKTGVGQAGQAAKDAISNDQQPEAETATNEQPTPEQPTTPQTTTAQATTAQTTNPELSDAQTERLAQGIELAAKIGDFTGGVDDAARTDMQQTAELLRSPEQLAAAKKALTENSDDIRQKMREAGIDPDKFLAAVQDATKQLDT